MKKPIVVLVIVAVMLLTGSLFAPTHAQDPANEEKPTFYRLTPGIYVNGWPRFTITYPKDWVERTPIMATGGSFYARAPGPTPGASLEVNTFPGPGPLDSLEKYADFVAQYFRNIAKEVTVVSDKQSRLRDGTAAREVELKMVLNNEPYNWLGVATKKGDCMISMGVGVPNVRIGEDLKAILYSLEFEAGKDERVKPPPDIQEFLDKYCSDLVSHDVAKVMTHLSDRLLLSGVRKGEIERYIRRVISSITSCEVGITELVPAGDRVYVAGFMSWAPVARWALGMSIIKEDGEWKWFGNQRDVSP